VYTSNGSPAGLTAPDEPGAYELRYLTGQAYATLGSARIEVTPTGASVEGPAEAVAGSTFPVKWQGPGNARDYLTLVPKGAKEGVSGNYRYTDQGNPAQLLAPLEPGEYELRYSTGQSHATLARAAIRITPATQSPGFVTVTVAPGAAGGNAVEIILDASGSMLQRMGAQRRIDVARLAATFRHWSDTGGGLYFDARDAAALDRAMTQALQPAVELVDAKGRVVAQGLAGGEPLQAMPGGYTVRLKGQPAKAQAVTVTAKETAAVRL
jgi:hypothetical protein